MKFLNLPSEKYIIFKDPKWVESLENLFQRLRKKRLMDSPKNTLNNEDVKAVLKNIVKFTAPALAVFFAQLQMGVNIRAAALVAALTLYGLLTDLFSKFTSGS